MPEASILIFRGVSHLYSYNIPESLSKELCVGCHVKVPFGRAETLGLVVKIIKEKNANPKLKNITSLVEEKYIIQEDIVNLIEWFSDHYQTTPFKAYQSIVGNKKIRNEKVEELKPSEEDHKLNEEQEKALNEIIAVKDRATEECKTILIHGVTSSGKTEVYIQATKKYIAEEKRVLMLVPEISLTPQYTEIFKSRFGSKIAVLHSGLTKKNKEIEWGRVINNEVDVVIGPRSAIFAPLSNIGLIIIDEEHENSYKQENHPRYSTHVVAEERMRQNGAVLVLGSATPSIESFYNLNKNDKTITLAKRVNDQKMPVVRIVDLKKSYQMGDFSLLSNPLKEAIKIRLEKNQKTIILLNRRGYATQIVCQKCGEVHTCSACNLSYTYHKDKKFRCHRCFKEARVTNQCSHCKSNSLSFAGIGIQKVETELKSLFPGQSILRLDKDTAPSAKKMEKIITEFKKSGNILIGTQMIAKGHHIEAVTLVGVLGVDAVLNIPDFRSPERTFQLVTQVAGRAGRGANAGEVIIQTFQPEHYAIQNAKNHDFKSFYEKEINFRKQLWYPPFSKLINIILSAKNERVIQIYSVKLAAYIAQKTTSFKNKIQWIGPKPAPVEKIQHYYRWNILLKYDMSVNTICKNIIKNRPKENPQLRVIIDFEPKALL